MGKTTVPADVFVKTYSDPTLSVGEVAKKLGLTYNQVLGRAKSYRGKGVNLPSKDRATGGRKVDVEALNKLIG